MTPEQQGNLYERCIAGNRKAQEELYKRFSNALFAVCLRFSAHRDEAKDMLQEGFLNIFRDLHLFDIRKGALFTWMRKVMVNACLQYIRKNEKFAQGKMAIAQQPISMPNAPTEVKITTEKLLQHLQNLPTGYRTVFTLHVMEGYTHTEISEVLGISVNTSKSQLSKGKSLLRKWLEEEYMMRKPKLLVNR